MTDPLDILIIGAGVSGIGSAAIVKTARPEARFLILANWSDTRHQWTVTAQTPQGTVTLTARFLWMCQGYYDHAQGFTPDWPGMADFQGPIVHPQTWPTALDPTGKRIVVIGSGSTARTNSKRR